MESGTPPLSIPRSMPVAPPCHSNGRCAVFHSFTQLWHSVHAMRALQRTHCMYRTRDQNASQRMRHLR